MKRRKNNRLKNFTDTVVAVKSILLHPEAHPGKSIKTKRKGVVLVEKVSASELIVKICKKKGFPVDKVQLAALSWISLDRDPDCGYSNKLIDYLP